VPKQGKAKGRGRGKGVVSCLCFLVINWYFFA
jgi:hypothetical protein